MICRLGAGLWLFCFQFFMGEQIARLGWAGHYSMTRNYISDLGAVHCGGSCSSLHWVMNGSFVLQGLLIVFGAVLLRGFVPAKPVYWIELALFVIAGLGVLEVGLVPEDVNPRLHVLAAVAHFLGGNLAMVLLGVVMIHQGLFKGRRLGFVSWMTFALGSAGLLATLALGFRGTPSWVALGWKIGAVERLAAYPLPLWLTFAGLLILRELA